jgi:hypothetical protein
MLDYGWRSCIFGRSKDGPENRRHNRYLMLVPGLMVTCCWHPVSCIYPLLHSFPPFENLAFVFLIFVRQQGRLPNLLVFNTLEFTRKVCGF